MIRLQKGNILDVEQGIILQGVNCQGVMGSGLAKGIRNKWPVVYDEYKEFCSKRHSDDLLGRINYVKVSDKLIVANGFTQQYYGRDPAKLYASPDAIQKVLFTLFAHNVKKKLPVYTVKLGCGLGGLTWQTHVQPLFSMYEHADYTLTIMEP